MPQPQDATPAPSRKWLPYLDGWRGFSVLAVLAGHFLPIPHINTGRLGVEMFFCLSGRLMAGILFLEHYPLRQFILRRISRVWPALYAFIAICAVAFAAPGPLNIGTVDIIGGLTFTENYVGIMLHRAPVFDHLWSLAVEEWAYLLLALLALICRRTGQSALPWLIVGAVLCIVNGLAQTLAGGDYYAVYWRTDVRVASILISCATFLLLRERPIHPIVPILAGGIGVLLNFEAVPDPVKYSCGTLLLAIAMATIDGAPAWLQRLLSNQPIRQIGLWSFSLYLWQQPFAKLEGFPAIARLAAAFVFAIMSFRLVEQPARSALNRLIRG
ncbi:acyltransferase [Novosphingobium sp. FKTRR1]|uniref:acyltransferase family protein n=1 Tax=Novosphingobium sp. FKTRR1 TaxID=2879118 RepID=UPI001CF0C3E1|nr:acyltransferase [Novosphingobium sp. FKTRR1]